MIAQRPDTHPIDLLVEIVAALIGFLFKIEMDNLRLKNPSDWTILFQQDYFRKDWMGGYLSKFDILTNYDHINFSSTENRITVIQTKETKNSRKKCAQTVQNVIA